VWNDWPLRGGGGSEQEEHGMILLVNSSVNLSVLWIRIRWICNYMASRDQHHSVKWYPDPTQREKRDPDPADDCEPN